MNFLKYFLSSTCLVKNSNHYSMSKTIDNCSFIEIKTVMTVFSIDDETVTKQWKDWCLLFNCKYTEGKSYVSSSNNDLFTQCHVCSITIPNKCYSKELQNILIYRKNEKFNLVVSSIKYI